MILTKFRDIKRSDHNCMDSHGVVKATPLKKRKSKQQTSEICQLFFA